MRWWRWLAATVAFLALALCALLLHLAPRHAHSTACDAIHRQVRTDPGYRRDLGCALLRPGRAPIISMHDTSAHPYNKYWLKIQTKFLTSVSQHIRASGVTLFQLGDVTGLSAEMEARLHAQRWPLLAQSNAVSHNASHFVFQPDYHFIHSNAWAKTLQDIRRANVSFDERLPTAFFRGSLTGSFGPCQHSHRVRFAQLAIDTPGADFRVIERCAGVEDDIYGNYTAEVEWVRHRGVFDIDGNINAFGLFWRLSSGSAVFRILHSERLLVNAYSRLLVPFEHYIPIHFPCPGEDIRAALSVLVSGDAADTSALRQMAERAAALTSRFTLESEVLRVAAELDRYFRRQRVFGGVW